MFRMYKETGSQGVQGVQDITLKDMKRGADDFSLPLELLSWTPCTP